MKLSYIYFILLFILQITLLSSLQNFKIYQIFVKAIFFWNKMMKYCILSHLKISSFCLYLEFSLVRVAIIHFFISIFSLFSSSFFSIFLSQNIMYNLNIYPTSHKRISKRQKNIPEFQNFINISFCFRPSLLAYILFISNKRF